MYSIGFLTTRFLDLSETFIYEPLRILNVKHKMSVYAWQRRNQNSFPFDRVFTWEDLLKKDRSRNSFWNNLGRERYLFSHMQKQKIQLLHAHYGYMGIAALQYKRRLNIPLVTHFYGLDVYKHTKNYFYRKQLRRLFSEGDLFFVCSNKMRADLIGLGALPSRVKVIYGGADLSKFEFKPKPFEEDQPIVILMCGRFVEKKGFRYGIQAFLNIAKTNERIQLRIIGSGQEEKMLKKLAGDSPFGSQVVFLGNKNHDEYIQAIRDSHIIMVPSVTAKSGDCEGLPTVLIEAAAIGRPLISTKHSGIPEIVHHEKNGILVEEKNIEQLSEGLTLLIKEFNLWDAYALYGRRLVEESFDMQKQTEMIERYYHTLLENLTI